MVMVATTQMACSWKMDDNLDRAEKIIRESAGKGANIILLQEFFVTPYFCPEQKQEYFSWAHPVEGHPFLPRFADLAKELGVVMPISFFERLDHAYFNSMMLMDADGSMQGVYRKTHIPQGPGYEEKFYFTPGDTGFKVWKTAFGTVGVGICWDQWFPEAARIMALHGADILLYPTAIGSEPQAPELNSKDHWQRVMQGHAAANMVALAASNRIGGETVGDIEMSYYGHSFIADETGGLCAECDNKTESVVVADFDFAAMRERRAGWGLFRDRRPEFYKPLLGLHGG